MMTLRFIVVERTRSPFLREGEAHYLARLQRYARPQWVEVKSVPVRKGLQPQSVQAAEGRLVLQKLGPRDYSIAVDRRGRSCTSPQLAQKLQSLALHHSQVAFLVGGALGFDKALLSQVDESLSLSPLTFTHEMARLILLEQVYRAFTILRGEKYHKA